MFLETDRQQPFTYLNKENTNDKLEKLTRKSLNEILLWYTTYLIFWPPGYWTRLPIVGGFFFAGKACARTGQIERTTRWVTGWCGSRWNTGRWRWSLWQVLLLLHQLLLLGRLPRDRAWRWQGLRYNIFYYTSIWKKITINKNKKVFEYKNISFFFCNNKCEIQTFGLSFVDGLTDFDDKILG